MNRRFLSTIIACATICSALIVPAGTARADNLAVLSTTLVSTTPTGNPGTTNVGKGSWSPVMSSNGRFVAYASSDADLLPDVMLPTREIFLVDRQTNTTEIVSRSSSGDLSNGPAAIPVGISDDGRYVAFNSAGTNLAPGVTTVMGNVYLRDRQTGTTTLVSQDPYGGFAQKNSMSRDGNIIVFQSVVHSATGGVDNTNTYAEYYYNRTTGMLSQLPNGVQPNLYSAYPTASGNGQFVSYDVTIPSPQGGITTENASYRYDITSGTSVLIANSANTGLTLSDDGSHAVYYASPYVGAGEPYGVRSWSVNLTDISAGLTQVVATNPTDAGQVLEAIHLGVSDDYRYITYLAHGDNELFLKDLLSAQSLQVSSNIYLAAGISADGTQVVYDRPLPNQSVSTLQIYVAQVGPYQLVAPTNLGGHSPTQQPVLSWSAPTGANSYQVYRDGTNIGSSNVTSFTDSSASDGTHSYSVTAVDLLGNESVRSSPLMMLVDQTAPSLSPALWSANPTTQGQDTNLTVPAIDNGSGVASGEYYLGSSDPGQGNATPMAWDGSNLVAAFGSTFMVGTYQINVRAKDAAGNWSSITTSSLDVSPMGAPPVITSAASANVNVRDVLSFIVTATGDTTPALIVMGPLPAGITFADNGDGTANLGGQATSSAGSYPIVITATNGSNGSASQNFNLNVTANQTAPTFLSDAADTESYGVPFSFTINTTGYVAPKLTKPTGALPPGVTFVDNGNGTATVAGTATKAAIGVYSFTLKAKNTSGSASQTFSLTITKAPLFRPIPGVKTKATVGVPFSLTVTTTGFSTPVLGESGNLPTGMVFVDNGNGTATISGTPTVGSSGTHTILLSATNQDGVATKSVTITVNEAPSFTSAANASATIGQPLSFQVIASGYPAPKFSLTGKLPKGITFKASTGTLSGTPKAGTNGTYPLVMKAKNYLSTSTQNFSLVVAPATPQ